MEIKLAGYNIDKSLIEQLPNQAIATPETISAAYARISRSKRSVSELREQSLKEVEKARISNENIIFEMGHSSIAEHAVFNFDLIGISRYLVEIIERTRLASFTEKSQRYVTLDGDFVIPPEIKNSSLEAGFSNLIKKQNELYSGLYEKGKKHLAEYGFAGTKRKLQGKAKEDARYVLALATETQLGMTINARSIAGLLRRLDSIDLAEAVELKKEIENKVKNIAPSLVRYTKSDKYEKEMLKRLPELEPIAFPTTQVELLGHSSFPEDSILASLYFEKYGYDPALLLLQVQKLSPQKKEKIFSDLMIDLKSFHSLPRAFEIAYFTFRITISSCCFGQLKRHRMCTILRSDYFPEMGYIIPPFIQKLKMKNEIDALMQQVQSLYHKLENEKNGLGNYILTNAHKLSVILKINLRELYHFSRLRSDKHAQWEIREVSEKIENLIKSQVPFAAEMMMGKDAFPDKTDL